MPSSFPTVSVVIPTYNRELFLSRALMSVVDQSFTSWEAIVVDNHSEDNTEQVIQNFKDPRIKLFKIQKDEEVELLENEDGESEAMLEEKNTENH